jgi:hypothetical protein
MNAVTYDLTTVEGIENVDTISVKAGTTVETFSIDCPVIEPEDGTGEDGTGDNDGNATITLSGCVLNATKEEIKKDGRSVRIGHAGAVTRAADGLWLESHGAQLRTLFEKAEGYTAWPLSGETELAAR